jgi:4-hydroxy-2-oxoheptanedioate aldolase
MSTESSKSDVGMAAYAAPSLFQPHNARQAVRDAHAKKIRPLLGVYYGVSSIPVARLLAPFGFDAVWIDWEHTACNIETMTTVSAALKISTYILVSNMRPRSSTTPSS